MASNIYGLFVNPDNLYVGIGEINPVANLQIGTTTQTSNVNETRYFNYAKQVALLGAYNNSPNVGDAIKLYIGNYNNDDASNVYPIVCEDENGQLDFFVKSRATALGTPTMFFAGNVGIGTTNPRATLDVNGSTKVLKFTSTNQTIGLGYPLSPQNGNWIMVHHNTFNASIGSQYPRPECGIVFANSSSEYLLPWSYYMGVLKHTAASISTSLRFDIGRAQDLNTEFNTSGTNTLTPDITLLNGNVGIGTTTPSQRLEVLGNAVINGSIGIGTTNPQVSLDVNGSGKFSGTLLNSGNPCFNVQYTGTNLNATNVIIWDDIYINRGSGYNNSTGRFTAPISGIYWFTYHCLGNTATQTQTVARFYNGSTTSFLEYTRCEDFQYGNCSCSFPLSMNQGNYIEILVVAGQFYGNGYNNFAGYLLFA